MADDLAIPEMVAWLREQIDEDGRVARATPVHEWSGGDEEWVRGKDGVVAEVSYMGSAGRALVDHIARHDPARELHEVEAKRRIIAEHTPPSPHGICQCLADWPCATLLSLLPIYADRPGFREEWRP